MAQKKRSLVANINRRKKAGTSRTRSRSTVSRKSYGDMQEGWPKKKPAARKSGARKASTRKSGARRSGARKTARSGRR